MEIHGVELDFSLFNEDKKEVKEKYFVELQKMSRVKENMPDGTEQERNKYLCDSIKCMFDNIFGEGTGVQVCGEDNDLLKHMDAYDQLVSEQIRQQDKYAEIMKRIKNMKVKK